MFAKILLIAAALAIVGVHGKPGVLAPAAVAYSAPLVAAAPAVVTAQSSQYIARNYNGIAPVAYTAAAPLAAAYTAYSAPLAYSTPLAYSAPLTAAYTAPVLL